MALFMFTPADFQGIAFIAWACDQWPRGWLYLLCERISGHTTLAGALFAHIRSAYYSIIRQYVIDGSDDVFRAIAARLSFTDEVTAAALAFIHELNSLVEQFTYLMVCWMVKLLLADSW